MPAARLLLVLCGLPGSGKSQLAARLLALWRSRLGSSSAACVVYDEYKTPQRDYTASRQAATAAVADALQAEPQLALVEPGPCEPMATTEHGNLRRDEVILSTTVSRQQRPASGADRAAEAQSHTAAVSGLAQKVEDSLHLTSDRFTIVIVDDTMHLASMRRSLFRLAREGTQSEGPPYTTNSLCPSPPTLAVSCLVCSSSFTARAAFVVVQVQTALDVCIERDAARPQPIGAVGIRHMAERFEAPDSSVRPWEPHVCLVSGAAAFAEQLCVVGVLKPWPGSIPACSRLMSSL